MKRLFAIGSTLIVAVALAAGCGSTDTHNAQDVSFAKDMTPHHSQAVVMADLALAQASSQQVKDLATRIKAAQGPEITKMKGWLSSWGEKAPDDMGGMDMSKMTGMQGMVDDAGMQALRGASGAPFDRLFLQDMTGHHQGAVAMAKVEIEKGKSADAKALAREITSGQEKEISEMGQLLQSLPT